MARVSGERSGVSGPAASASGVLSKSSFQRALAAVLAVLMVSQVAGCASSSRALKESPPADQVAETSEGVCPTDRQLTEGRKIMCAAAYGALAGAFIGALPFIILAAPIWVPIALVYKGSKQSRESGPVEN